MFTVLKRSLTNVLSEVSRTDFREEKRLPRSVFAPKTKWTGFYSKVNQEEYFSGTSVTYIKDMNMSWLLDPKILSSSWNIFFKNCANNTAPGSAFQAPSTLHQSGISEVVHVWQNKATKIKGELYEDMVINYYTVLAMIKAYQTRGHYVARIDPLTLSKRDLEENYLNELLYQSSSPFRKMDLDRAYKLPPTTMIGGKDDALPLKEILKRLENAYCRSIGVEYIHISSSKMCNWIRERVEVPERMVLDKKEKTRALKRFMMATGFETFLDRKWTSEKRFGLEGCEALIPALNGIIDESSASGVNTVFMGMAHRGRLNVLANVCQTPLSTIFKQFHGLKAEDEGSGDVKYHLDTSTEYVNEVTEKKVKIVLVANPSHLEAVNLAVQGKTRSEQFSRGDVDGKEVMPILIHGDSSFCGQVDVNKTLHLSDLPDYTTHGTIHVVVSYQIGFTTNPQYSRSSFYCMDVARVMNIPIFHVNGDDPEAVMQVCKIAAEWRSTFKKDIVIDIVCYRKNGHNEVDEPKFTQPHMYDVVKITMPVFNKFAESLVKENVITKEEVDKEWNDYQQFCETAFTASTKETRVNISDWLISSWSGFFKDKNVNNSPKTGVNEDTLKHTGNLFSSVPTHEKEFVVDKSLERIFKNRQPMFQERSVDWALIEAMSIESLTKDAVHVRLSGQDKKRGTSLHRHDVLKHEEFDETLCRPLCHMANQNTAYSSSSELAEPKLSNFFGFRFL